MKIFHIFLFCFYSILSFAKGIDFKVDSIVIRQASWSILTPTNVPCHDFESSLPYDEYHITDKNDIRHIMKGLSNLKRTNLNIIDPRCKILFYYKDSLITVACAEISHLLYKGIIYKMPHRLFHSIKNVEKNNTFSKPTDIKQIVDTFPFPNGMDSLQHFLQSQNERFSNLVNDTLSVTIVLFINNQGRTVEIKIKEKKDTRQKLTPNIIEELKQLFVDEIRWIPREDRSPRELLIIPFKIFAVR